MRAFLLGTAGEKFWVAGRFWATDLFWTGENIMRDPSACKKISERKISENEVRKEHSSFLRFSSAAQEYKRQVYDRTFDGVRSQAEMRQLFSNLFAKKGASRHRHEIDERVRITYKLRSMLRGTNARTQVFP